MAELKRDFSGAKMNKDMDERVLPPGQYRDAKNIKYGVIDDDVIMYRRNCKYYNLETGDW